MVAKHSLNPKNFYYADTLSAAQVTALPEEVDGKNRLESEQVLISNLYLCLGEKGQDELHKRRPHLDLSAIRYPRMLDALETEFKKERNETYETYRHERGNKYASSYVATGSVGAQGSTSCLLVFHQLCDRN